MKTILLVEDNASDIALTRRALESAGARVSLVIVEDGQEALDYVFGTGAYTGRDVVEQPHLTLLDLKLPKVPGLDVLRRIRGDARTKRMPVVIFTSSKDEPDVAASYELGCNSYVQKAVDFLQFAAEIESLRSYWLALNEPPPQVNGER